MTSPAAVSMVCLLVFPLLLPRQRLSTAWHGFTGSQTFDVAPGAYTVTESPVPEGWALYSSVDKDGVETLGDASVDVTLADLETATIYFYNHKNVGPIWPVPELAAGILLALGLGRHRRVYRHKEKKSSQYPVMPVKIRC